MKQYLLITTHRREAIQFEAEPGAHMEAARELLIGTEQIAQVHEVRFLGSNSEYWVQVFPPVRPLVSLG